MESHLAIFTNSLAEGRPYLGSLGRPDPCLLVLIRKRKKVLRPGFIYLRPGHKRAFISIMTATEKNCLPDTHNELPLD